MNLELCKSQWESLGNISIDDEECIEQPFLDFPVGTHRKEIWYWFEETYDVSAHDLMMGLVK